MKKIFFIMIVQIFVVKFAFAQRGLHGNSDWKVPVPVINPQIEPVIHVNSITIPAIPIIPPYNNLFGASATPVNLVPAIPNTPLTPPVQPNGIASSALSPGELRMRFPDQPLLPPLPAIPSPPTVKMPII